MKANQNWKARQKAYHSTRREFDDSIENHDVCLLTSDTEIVEKALEYFYKDSEVLYYPSKSYSVALIYSHLLSQYFDVDAVEVLNDPELLFNNDPYFKPYSESPHIYDRIIAKLPRFFWTSETKSVKKTLQCFYEEFGVYST